MNEAGISVIPFRSRKHATVELTGTFLPLDLPSSCSGVIVKHFDGNCADLLAKEQAILEASNLLDCHVPPVLLVLDNFLVLGKVPGKNLIDLLHPDRNVASAALPRDAWEPVCSALGAWLAAFHAGFAGSPLARRRGDANLRNFVMAPDGELFGVDFEEADCQDPLVDLQEVIDSLFLTDPGMYSARLDEISQAHGRAMANLRRHGIAVAGYFMVGLDGDTAETFAELFDFIHRCRVNVPIINILLPAPGTAVSTA